MIYLDTSVVGALFFREPGAARVFDRLEPLRREGLVISAWTLTEMASVGGIKQRTGAIDGAHGVPVGNVRHRHQLARAGGPGRRVTAGEQEYQTGDRSH